MVVTVMPLLSANMSPFEGLVERLLEPIDLPLQFYKPSFAQDIIKSLAPDPQVATDILGMVRLFNERFIASAF